jgi:hypothetical protein
MADGTEPIDPSETIYRRVPKRGTAYKPNRNPALGANAFNPRPTDADGVSVTRASYVSGPDEAAALGAEGMEFYVIAFLARDLQAVGMEIVPDPNNECLGHALIRNIHAANSELPQIQAIKNQARMGKYHAFGPFPGKMKITPPGGDPQTSPAAIREPGAAAEPPAE